MGLLFTKQLRRSVDVAKLLLQNNVDVDAVDAKNRTALCMAAGIDHSMAFREIGVDERHIRCILQLLCFGAKIDENAINLDERIARATNDKLNF